MQLTRRSVRGGLIVRNLALVGLLLVVGAVAAYAHGGNTGAIHSCVNNASGIVRIVGPNDSCRSNETATDWSIQGPPGPPGPPGSPGSSVSLRQSYPISDAAGVIAFGTTAIGWQAASSDFQNTVVAFAICSSASGTVNYRSAQGVGLARAFCLSGETLTGGGGFVEVITP